MASAGLLAWDDATVGPRPGVMIAHTIRGRTEFEERKARQLADQGYAALAIDLYGKDTRGSELAGLRKRMTAYLDNRESLGRQLAAWHEALQRANEVDGDRTAAIGYCFGGLCALDAVRTGIGLRGAASFHGLLAPHPHAVPGTRDTRVLLMHGWDDPLATPDDVLTLTRELTRLDFDWQLHAYGHTLHAFTNPAADDPAVGTVYNAAADRRSAVALRQFLSEIFAD